MDIYSHLCSPNPIQSMASRQPTAAHQWQLLISSNGTMGPRKHSQRLEKLLEEEQEGRESVAECRPFYEVDPVWIQYRTQEEIRQQTELYVEGDNMEEVAKAQDAAVSEGITCVAFGAH